ncbi:CoA transferase [Streptosporangium vulgare]|uniref:CoA transferase n=1 Tax=Streptosporangium vulgare TaxID=46190 RepID=UPI0033798FC3
MEHVTRKGPLAGVRVLELAGLAPGPFAGMMLADHGAEVLRVERASVVARAGDRPRPDVMDRGKRTVGLDLKSPEGVAAFKELGPSRRRGRRGLPAGGRRAPRHRSRRPARGQPAPDLRADDRLGPGRPARAPTAGHDIDYIAVSGVLSMLGREGERPTPPINILGDFAGGGLMLAYGVLLALIERERTGEGRVIDAAMVDGAATLFAMFHHGVQTGGWGPRGTNLLDTGAPMYDTYETADGRYVAVGALEPQFWAEMTTLMGLEDLPDRDDRSQWPALRERLAEAFRSRTRAEWEAVFRRLRRLRLPRARRGRGRGPPAQQGQGPVRRGRAG